ncbi:Uncharacterised protein [Chlamydia trachomatis]|nr:Uncharacterised protein [Chlamydia trachomatis]
MGCDIHMYVEYKRENQESSQWKNGDYFRINESFGEFEDENKFNQIGLYDKRNYSLFSTLAGVRDYSEKIIPVSEPKGLPDDISDYVKKESDDWEGDGHTHSWLTLKELRDYNNNSPVLHFSGMISSDQAEKLDAGIENPNSWCQWTSREDYVKREWSEKNLTLNPLIDLMQTRAKELLQYHYQDYDLKNDENIRIVFWFDN